MSKKCYGIGVIGCGYIWEHGHWEALKVMPGEAQVRFVYDIDTARMQAAAALTGAKAVDDPVEMSESPDVDIIAILTPPYARTEYVKMACAAGKSMMLEKPIARTLEDAINICLMIKQSKVKCLVPLARSCSLDQRQIVEIIQSGQLGDPLVFCHRSLAEPYPWIGYDHWMLNQELSGGPIFDNSIHSIEFASACMGSQAKEVLYAGRNYTGRVPSDDHATLQIYYESGALGEFTNSWSFPSKINFDDRTLFIACRDAVITAQDGWKIYTRDGVKNLYSEDMILKHNGRADTYRNLILGMERDTPLYCDEINGLRTNEILDAALKSRESGKKEPVVIHQI